MTAEMREIEAFWRISGAPPIWVKDRENITEEDYGRDVYPARVGPMLRVDKVEGQGDRIALVMDAQFGLVPHWVKKGEFEKFARNTYNARTETVHEKPSFRTAWKYRNFCVIPAKSIYEPCYDAEFLATLDPNFQLPEGKSVPVRISRKDGKPIWIAGICWAWKDPDTDEYRESFSMLTVNADDHPMFMHFHAPGDERRIVVMLKDVDVHDWLHCDHDAARTYFAQYPAEELEAAIAPNPPRQTKPKPVPARPKKDQVPISNDLLLPPE
jgi:putative SOS response-associated peptidase YedK